MHFKPAPLLTVTVPLGSDPGVRISILILLPSRNANPPSKLNGARCKLYGELKRFNKVRANDVALPRRTFAERRRFSSGVVKGKVRKLKYGHKKLEQNKRRGRPWKVKKQ